MKQTPSSCTPTHTREDTDSAVFDCVQPCSVVFASLVVTRCSGFTAQHRLPALRLRGERRREERRGRGGCADLGRARGDGVFTSQAPLLLGRVCARARLPRSGATCSCIPTSAREDTHSAVFDRVPLYSLSSSPLSSRGALKTLHNAVSPLHNAVLPPSCRRTHHHAGLTTPT